MIENRPLKHIRDRLRSRGIAVPEDPVPKQIESPPHNWKLPDKYARWQRPKIDYTGKLLHEKKRDVWGSLIMLASLWIGYNVSGDKHPGLGFALSIGVGLLLCYLISLVQKKFND
jgi:hypothetical protein